MSRQLTIRRFSETPIVETRARRLPGPLHPDLQPLGFSMRKYGFRSQHALFLDAKRCAVASPLLPRQAFFIVCENQKRLENTSGFEYYASSCPLPASKYAILFGENRLFRHPRKTAIRVHNKEARIDRKSKSQILKNRRQFKYKIGFPTPESSCFLTIQAHFLDEY